MIETAGSQRRLRGFLVLGLAGASTPGGVYGVRFCHCELDPSQCSAESRVDLSTFLNKSDFPDQTLNFNPREQGGRARFRHTFQPFQAVEFAVMQAAERNGEWRF